MRGGDNRPRETRVNERIRAREVRVIDETGQMLGVMTSVAALQLARERDVDLVEVSPMVMPPVCKLMDWGRYKYEQSKKENEARKHQKITQLREIRMRPRTDDHDIGVKVRKIEEFLGEGDKVKVSVIFRGREMAHPELGRVLLDAVTQQLKGTAAIERTPLMEGKMMSMIVTRAPGWEPKKHAPQPGAGALPSDGATPATAVATESPAPPVDTATADAVTANGHVDNEQAAPVATPIATQTATPAPTADTPTAPAPMAR
ncbi:MAG TPA: translation initiation factor IF-3 [Ktedonobacterales bacterium]|jgi:translation initiation factor IF-3